MPRLDGVRERLHQPFYDSLVRGIGQSTVPNLRALFGNANVGSLELTNLQVPGQLDSDKTFIIKSLRSILAFQGLDGEYGTFGDLPDLDTNSTATNRRAQDLYALMAYGAIFNLRVGDKSMFVAPIWYTPAGGGPHGHTTENSRGLVTNGVPSHEAVLYLGKDIHVPARQSISVTIQFFPFARQGDGQGGALPNDLDPLAYLNEFDGLTNFQFMVDGMLTRDVQ